MMEELDPLIDCIDSNQSEMRVCRRAALAGCLAKSGVVMVTIKALSYVSQAAKFFDDIPILEWLNRVWPSQLHDVEERAIRFVEEGLELGQALGMSRDQGHRLIDQVFDKPVGNVDQELGGTLITLSALMAVAGLDGVKAFTNEFARVNSAEIIDKIQAKHKMKLVVSSSQRQ